MSEQASANIPADTITVNGDKYVSERALASWGVIELMVRNPGLSEVVSTLEARLEKAEAKSILRSKTRNDALEEAAKEVDCECKGRDVVLSPNVRSNSPERWEACGEANCCALAAFDIRLLKSQS